MSILMLFLMAAQAPIVRESPATDQLGFDIRCMVATQAASENVDGAVKAAIELSMMFYFGRVDSALSGSALEQRFEAEGKALEGKPLGPILQQCGEFMKERGKALQAIGAKLEARERAPKLQ